MIFKGERQTKKDKRHSRKKLKTFGFIAFILVLLLGVDIFSLLRPLYISPIPFGGIATTFPLFNDGTAELSQKLLDSHVGYNKVISSGDYFTVQLSGGEDILFSKKKSLSSQISSLQLIVSTLTIEGKRIARIDFRFDNPVVTFR